MAKHIMFIGDDLLDPVNSIPTYDQSYLHWLEIFETQVPFTCTMLGHCGTTTNDVLETIDQYLNTFNPDLIVFSCGLNDIIAGYSSTVTVNNVKQIFQKIDSQGKLGLHLLPPMEGVDPVIIEEKEQRYQEFAQACLSINSQKDYDRVINLMGIHLGLIGSLDKESYYNDDLLTSKGHNYVASVMVNVVTRLMSGLENKPEDIKVSSKVFANRLNRQPIWLNIGSESTPVWKELWFNAESLSSITVKPEWRA